MSKKVLYFVPGVPERVLDVVGYNEKASTVDLANEAGETVIHGCPLVTSREQAAAQKSGFAMPVDDEDDDEAPAKTKKGGKKAKQPEGDTGEGQGGGEGKKAKQPEGGTGAAGGGDGEGLAPGI